jgi:membrane associated rhomboid family serine protease
MGLAIAASLVLPTGLGYVVGDQFGVSVEMAFAGLALGVVLAVVLLRTQIRKYM